MIRTAVPADLPDLVRMVAAFDAAAGIAVDGPGEGLCPGHVARALSLLMQTPRGLVLVLEIEGRVRGMLLAEAGATLFRPALWADERAFWIDPEARGRWAGAMVRRYVEWARQIGARIAGLSALDDRAALAFGRMGFEPVEVKLMRRV